MEWFKEDSEWLRAMNDSLIVAGSSSIWNYWVGEVSHHLVLWPWSHCKQIIVGGVSNIEKAKSTGQESVSMRMQKENNLWPAIYVCAIVAPSRLMQVARVLQKGCALGALLSPRSPLLTGVTCRFFVSVLTFTSLRKWICCMCLETSIHIAFPNHTSSPTRSLRLPISCFVPPSDNGLVDIELSRLCSRGIDSWMSEVRYQPYCFWSTYISHRLSLVVQYVNMRIENLGPRSVCGLLSMIFGHQFPSHVSITMQLAWAVGLRYHLKSLHKEPCLSAKWNYLSSWIPRSSFKIAILRVSVIYSSVCLTTATEG